MARLPINGGDPENWGAVLNEFLLVGHNEDGTVKQAVGPAGPEGPAGPAGSNGISSVYHFDTVGDRDATLPTPLPGTLAWTPETGVFMYYGSFWAPLPGTQTAELVASAVQNFVSSANYMTMNLATNEYLPFGQTRTVADRYVFPYTGRWRLEAHAAFGVIPGNTTYRVYAQLLATKSGVATPIPGAHESVMFATTGFTQLSPTGTLTVSANDYVQLQMAHNYTGVNSAVSGPAVSVLRAYYLGALS